jgi:hypothetical protein
MCEFITITDVLVDSLADPVLELRSGELLNLSTAQGRKFPPDTEVRLPDEGFPGHKWHRLSWHGDH